MIPALLVKAHDIAARFRASAKVPLLNATKKGDAGELYIYAAIGQSWWSDGVTAQAVVEKLDELRGVKKLSVRINSEGGDVWDAKAIENAIRRFEADEKVTYVDGLAASAATFIALACPKVVSAANATWMVHEAATVAMGRACDMRAMADVLDMENQTIAETYARKTGMSVKECLGIMSAETWMNAAQSLDRGFSDEIDKDEEEESEEEDLSASAPGAIIGIAAATQRRIETLHDQARRARMQMRIAAIEDSRRASPATTRDGQPERAAAARKGGTPP